jgi:hypothetical protein
MKNEGFHWDFSCSNGRREVPLNWKVGHIAIFYWLDRGNPRESTPTQLQVNCVRNSELSFASRTSSQHRDIPHQTNTDP